ncbi:MAG TPA: N-acetyl-gamma-glutamyl-phosphate reductase [Microthrixaceae bacterium]|nr:N-acetyl-gamma-glutamyl-phosphate reductase [Microthrixaceae bacterium]
MQDGSVKIGIIGASGFAGSEVLRLTASHPSLELAWATGDSQAGTAIADLYPSLAAAYGGQRFVPYDTALLADVDAVFLALPHGASQALVPELVGRVRWVIDLAADFRLQEASLYDQWYGISHTAPELLPSFAYGLPELYRDQVAEAQCVAAPGCYPTAAILALEPLVRTGIIEPTGVIVDAASGVSGAGRPPKPNTTFCTVDEDFTAYGLLDHRHTPEMEIHSGASVLFTPHLAPMSRGILATCYGRPARQGLSTASVMDALHDAYAGEPFVVVSDRVPSTKATQGSNCAHLSARYDDRTGTVIVLSAIDNLVKGTAGQAIQCLNLMAGLGETTGLPVVGLTP